MEISVQRAKEAILKIVEKNSETEEMSKAIQCSKDETSKLKKVDNKMLAMPKKTAGICVVCGCGFNASGYGGERATCSRKCRYTLQRTSRATSGD